MKTSIILILASLLTAFSQAQSSISWVGGTPGKETTWNEPRNWDDHKVPAEHDKVVIKKVNSGHGAQPVIESNVHIAWLEIHSGAKLAISEGSQLILDGAYTYSEGISIYGGDLYSEGEILFKDIEFEFIANLSPVCLDPKVSYYSELYRYEFCVASSFVNY